MVSHVPGLAKVIDSNAPVPLSSIVERPSSGSPLSVRRMLSAAAVPMNTRSALLLLSVTGSSPEKAMVMGASAPLSSAMVPASAPVTA